MMDETQELGLTARDGLARAIGYALSPLTLPPLLVIFVLLYFRAPPIEIVAVTAIVLVLLSIVPALLLVWMVRSGRVRSVQVEDRSARGTLSAFAIGCGLATIPGVLLVSRTATTVLIALLVAYLLNVAVLMMINRSYRISLHAAGAAGFGVAIIFVGATAWEMAHTSMELWMLASGSILIAGSVGWARLREGVHTKLQVIGGWIVGGFVTFVELVAAMKMGVFVGV